MKDITKPEVWPGEVAPPAAPPGDDAPVRGYLGLLRRYPHLRNLWLGQLVSFAGDWFNTIALYDAVQSLSSRASAVTLVMVAKTLPVFLTMPVSGPLVDRFDRRRLLLASDALRAACAMMLVIAYATGSLWGLYAGTILMMCGTGLAVPAKNAVLPMLVPRLRVPMANALLGGTWSVMLAAGAALGGLATELLGVSAALLVDGATFVLSAGFFWQLPALPPARQAPGATSGPDRGAVGFSAGLRYLGRHRYVLALAALKPMMQLHGGLVSLTPLLGTVVYQGFAGPLYVGLLFAVRGLGAAVGSLALRAVLGDSVRTMRGIVWAGYLLGGASFASLAACDAYWQAALALFAAALAQGAIWVASGSLLQLEAERRFHGRVFSLEFGTNMLTISASSLAVGMALDAGVSLDAVTAGFGALAVVPLCLWSAVLWRLRSRGGPAGGRATDQATDQAAGRAAG